MAKSEITKERQARQRASFFNKIKIAFYALCYALTGLFILSVVGLAVYAALRLLPHAWYTWYFLAAAGWTIAPVLGYAGRGFLKEGIFKVLTDLARNELAKKEAKG